MLTARIYMRVSTDHQDLQRQEKLIQDTRNNGFYIAGVYREKISGVTEWEHRPELYRLINELQPNDVVVAESIDRLTRLEPKKALELINAIKAKGAKIQVPEVFDFESDAPDGLICKGDANVLVNNLPITTILLPNSINCNNHALQMIAEGRKTVFVDGKNVARKGDKTTCNGKINSGSPNVFFGSGRAAVSPIVPEFSLVERDLLIAVEFVIPPSATFRKGIRKAVTQSGKSVAMRGAYVGAAVVSRAKNIYRKSIKRFNISKNTSPYSHIPDSKFVGPGKKFTKLQKDRIIQENMKKNHGVVKSDMSGQVLFKPSKSQKGVTPPDNEWQIDHIKARSKGGSNSYSNAQVLSCKENRLKSDKEDNL